MMLSILFCAYLPSSVFFSKVSFSNLCLFFFNWLLIFPLLILEGTLYIMDVSPSSEACWPEIFSQSVTLEEQRCLILIKFEGNFSHSNLVSCGRRICLARGHEDSSCVYSVVRVLHIPADFLFFPSVSYSEECWDLQLSFAFVNFSLKFCQLFLHVLFEDSV